MAIEVSDRAPGPAPFTYLLRVRYAECDAQRVVFHSRYAEYADVAVTEFIRALGFGEEAASGALEYQLVRQTLEWRAPGAHIALMPPSITTSEPVMKLDSSDARNTIGQPTSSGRPSLPIGTWRPSFCCISSSPKRAR